MWVAPGTSAVTAAGLTPCPRTNSPQAPRKRPRKATPAEEAAEEPAEQPEPLGARRSARSTKGARMAETLQAEKAARALLAVAKRDAQQYEGRALALEDKRLVTHEETGEQQWQYRVLWQGGVRSWEPVSEFAGQQFAGWREKLEAILQLRAG